MPRRHDIRKRRAARPRSKVSRKIRIPVERTDVPPDFSIVGIGASAGGFEAFTQMLDAMPPDPRLAMVFVQHLAPQHASSLASLLAGYSKLPVSEAVEGVRLEANHLYVVPPNVQMELVDGHLHLGPRPEDRTQYTPIDFFFRSLARTLQNHAIGVVLSGTASDGSAGVREIKSMGGITVAQDPSTAKYDGMPRSAIATQMIDLVLSPRDIATKLVQIAKHPYPPPPPAGTRHIEPTITEEQLERVLALLLPACGVDFMHYKTPTIIRRLFRRMTLLRMADAEAYITFLAQTPAEVVNLHNELLIHVTRFFREPEAFAALARPAAGHRHCRRRAASRLGRRVRDRRRGVLARDAHLRDASAIGWAKCACRFSVPTSASRRSSTPGMDCIRRRSPRTSRPNGCAGFSPEAKAAIE